MNMEERKAKRDALIREIMNLYFAPMEGIGGYIYRNAQADFLRKRINISRRLFLLRRREEYGKKNTGMSVRRIMNPFIWFPRS